MNSKRDYIDPVGVELAISIFSTLISVVSLLVEMGIPLKKQKDIKEKIEAIQQEILRLHNALDDLILTLERMRLRTDDIDISNNSCTISDTLLELRERDYLRWADIRDAIKRIDTNIYILLKEVRALSIKYASEHTREPFDQELIASFDNVLLGMSKFTFGEFISELRALLNLLSNRLGELARLE
jgi:hypothetical protein